MNLEQDKLQQNPVRATVYVLRFNEKKVMGHLTLQRSLLTQDRARLESSTITVLMKGERFLLLRP